MKMRRMVLVSQYSSLLFYLVVVLESGVQRVTLRFPARSWAHLSFAAGSPACGLEIDAIRKVKYYIESEDNRFSTRTLASCERRMRNIMIHIMALIARHTAHQVERSSLEPVTVEPEVARMTKLALSAARQTIANAWPYVTP
jgi:hypothetical protein